MTQLNLTLHLEGIEAAVFEYDLVGVVKSTVILMLNELMKKEHAEDLQAVVYGRNDMRLS